jgi:hypothetical protein
MGKLTGRVPERLPGRLSRSSRVETFWDVFWETFEDVQIETHGFTEVGSEVVGPQITRLRLFQEQAEALEAAGLSE